VRILIFLSLVTAVNPVWAKLCNPAVERCWKVGGSSSSSPAYPSKNSSIKINPAGVPLEKVWGGEFLYYDSDVDFAIVRGMGRVGAAISLSNGEETFFGPMGFEETQTYLERMQEGEKFESQKLTLAGAVGLYGNKKGGLRRLQVNLGLIGKYNKESEEFYPGGGLSVVLGPVTLGYAYAKDNFFIKEDPFWGTPELNFKYDVETLSASIFLSSVAIDFSHMRVHIPNEDMANVNLLTGSLLLNKWIITGASRHESSERPAYNYKTKGLEWEREKFETFGGVQYSVTKVLMIGMFHNYYLLRELSIGATLFF
jgi:hypothetical protein